MDEHNDQKFPKEATFKKWKEKFPWLKILSISQQKKNNMRNLYQSRRKIEANASYEFDICKQKHKL